MMSANTCVCLTCPCTPPPHLHYCRPPTGASKAGGGSSSKKRARKAADADAAGGLDADADDSDDFMEAAAVSRRPSRKSGRSSAASSSNAAGAGGTAMLADLMRVALDAGVTQLVEMGYSRSKAIDALKECNCDVEAAVEYLTAACC